MKYKLIYEAKKVIKGSVSGVPAASDKTILDLNSYGEKQVELVYEKEGKIYISYTGIPAAEDTAVLDIKDLIEEGAVETAIPHVEAEAETKAEATVETPKKAVKSAAKK